MPLSPGEAKKNMGSAAQRRWSRIANNVLKQTGKESQAVRIADSATRVNPAIKRRLQKGKP